MRRKVEFTRYLRAHITDLAQSEGVAHPPTWRRNLIFLAAAALLVICGLVFIAERPGYQLPQMAEQRQPPGRVDPQSRPGEKKPSSEANGKTAKAQNVIALLLLPASERTTRGEPREQNDLLIPPGDHTIELRASVDVESGHEYRASLATVEGTVQIRPEDIRVRVELSSDKDKQTYVVVAVSSSKLFSGTYILNLEGKAARGEWEPVDAYSVEVRKQ